MDQQRKPSCVLFRTIVEAAKEMDKEEALELLLTYADYALGDTEEIETDNKYIKLILKQTIPALSAAERRYEAACNNGPKGGEIGKERGGGVGRPRKDETPEDYQKRVNEWRSQKTPSKTPEEPPVITPTITNQKPPENPHDVDAEVYEDKEEDVYVDKEKNNFLENIVIKFINKYSNLDYSLNDEEFSSKYNHLMSSFQNFVKEQSGVELPIMFYSHQVIHYARTGRLDESQEKITYA